ncbi:MAG: GtrA family protein [Myxococcota bacterium]
MKAQQRKVAIVVPAYNEAGRLPVAEYEAFLGGDLNTHLVFVNDGSTDETLQILEQMRERWPDQVAVLDQQPNAGKAESVRAGVLWALERPEFEYVGYFDADLATPLSVIDEFLAVLEDEHEISLVMGARVALLGRHVERKWIRHYLGRVFATAASLTLELPVYDTQCGAKLFRVDSDTRSLFEVRFSSRWVFDVEIIARYLERRAQHSRLGIYEYPLRRWVDVGESKVKALDFIRAFGDMARIYRKYPLKRRFDTWVMPLTRPFVKYGLAGGVGTVFHYALLLLLTQLSVLSPPWAATVGAFGGALLNYVLNYNFTFGSEQAHSKTFPKFFAVSLLGMVASGLGVAAGTALGVHYLVSQLVCTGLVLVVGFFLNRFWTFAERRGR